MNESNMNLDVDMISIHELQPAIYNPRKISRDEMEKLKNSIKSFGLTDPIIINLRNHNTIIGGHQRYKALMEIMDERGEKDKEFILVKRGDVGFCFTQELLNVQDLTKEKALNIALNKISGEWNEYKLTYLLMDIESAGMNIELTGFDEIDLSLDNISNPVQNMLPFSKKESKKMEKLKKAEKQDELNDEWEFKLPTYTPKRPKEKIQISDLYKLPDVDYSKYIEKIKNPEMKKLLYMRAAWFTIFNFEKIANYYTFQATDEEKLVFEKLALVTLDKDQLIEHGFLKAGKRLEEFKDEFEDED